MIQNKGRSDLAAHLQAATPWPIAGNRGSIEVTVMNYAGITSAAVITGFAAYHYFTGNVTSASINALIAVLLIAVLMIGLNQQFTRTALVLFGAVVTVSCVVSAMSATTACCGPCSFCGSIS